MESAAVNRTFTQTGAFLTASLVRFLLDSSKWEAGDMDIAYLILTVVLLVFTGLLVKLCERI
jgi:hypothetical protein